MQVWARKGPGRQGEPGHSPLTNHPGDLESRKTTGRRRGQIEREDGTRGQAGGSDCPKRRVPTVAGVRPRLACGCGRRDRRWARIASFAPRMRNGDNGNRPGVPGDGLGPEEPAKGAWVTTTTAIRADWRGLGGCAVSRVSYSEPALPCWRLFFERLRARSPSHLKDSEAF